MIFLTAVDLLILAFGCLILLVWLILFFGGRKNAWMFEQLNDKDYPVKEVYFIGYYFIEKLNLQFKTKRDRKLRKEMAILYDEKYADYYIRVAYSQQFTMALTVLTLAAPFYFFTEGSLLVFIAVLGGAGAAFYYYGTVTKKQISDRAEQLLSDFSDVVSKLALLVNSGMILREAWERTAYSKEGVLYSEMRRSVIAMQNGQAEIDALFSFGQRCMLPEIKKFSSTLIQGVTKGNSDLAMMLTDQSKEVWALKKQYVHRQGELANNKLLLPMCLTFVGILIMVIVPIFSNLGT